VSYTHEMQVRFQDVDAGGVLFYGRIYDYIHVAYEEFWASEGVDRGVFFAGSDYLIPVAHSEADYRTPIRHGERVRVRLDVVKVGRASFTLRHHVTGADGSPRVDALTVHAFVRKETMRPIGIPDPLRAILLRHLVPEPVPHHAP
jgi:YbgC/YbaW family acyl-CoA thioester hydrolase